MVMTPELLVNVMDDVVSALSERALNVPPPALTLSIHMLPEPWRTFTLFNPIVYLMSGFRWTFYSTADVGITVSLGMTMVFLLVCLVAVSWIFRTGYRLKS